MATGSAKSPGAPPVEGPSPVQFELDASHLEEGSYTLVIPIPEEIISLIGRVVINWGGFELRMNALIGHIFVTMGKVPEPRWEFQSFDRRKSLFKSLLTEYTHKMFPNETKTSKGLLTNRVTCIGGETQLLTGT
jgi:hypothetical protein